MCTISLEPILTENIDFTQAGSVFYDRLKGALDTSEKITVNMENVNALPSIFLNVSIGKIIEEYGLDKIRSSISFAKINKAQALRLQDYLMKFKKN